MSKTKITHEEGARQALEDALANEFPVLMVVNQDDGVQLIRGRAGTFDLIEMLSHIAVEYRNELDAAMALTRDITERDIKRVDKSIRAA